MMYIEVTFSVFCDQFQRMDRGNQFTYEGKKTLFRYLDEIDEEKTELDVIALCCDWAEYTEEELMKEYNRDGEHEDFSSLKEWINDRTTMLETEGDSFLVMAF